MTANTPIPAVPLTDDGRTDYQGPRPGGPRGGARNVGWGWWVALVMTLAVVVIGAILLFGGEQVKETRNVSVSEIVDDPAGLMDHRLVVTGRIEELLTERALAIGTDTAADDLLVLIEPSATIYGYGIGATSGVPLPIGETYQQGDVVQFAGTLRMFDRERLAEELGLVLNADLFASWEGEPSLVIDRLDVATVGQPLVLPTAAPESQG